MLHWRKKYSLLTTLCLDVMCFFDLIYFNNFFLTKVALKKRNFLSAINVIFCMTWLRFWNFSGSFHTNKEQPLLPLIFLNITGSLIWLNFISFFLQYFNCKYHISLFLALCLNLICFHDLIDLYFFLFFFTVSNTGYSDKNTISSCQPWAYRLYDSLFHISLLFVWKKLH